MSLTTDFRAVIDAYQQAQRPSASGHLVPSPSNPMAVARALVQALYTESDGLVLRDHRGDFYRWNGAAWADIDRRDIRAAAYAWLEQAVYLDADGQRVPFAPTRRKIDDVVDAMRAIVLVESTIDAPAWLMPMSEPAIEIVSMANGLLHVPTRTLLPHTPHFFGHHSLPFAFLANALPPTRWLTFLRQLWPEDESSIQALQEVLGYILGGDTRLQKIFLLNGPKRAGKGTIGRVLTGLLGKHHVAAPTLASLCTNFGLQPLVGKPLALVSDARLSQKADSKIVVERLLSISGEDSLTIDRKYRDPWTGRLPTRFVIMTNELPHLTDSSGALASRFVVFVLTRSFYGAENPRLTDELLAEAPAIFNWALEGLDRLTERGYFVTPESGAEAIQQLEDLSSPISAFVRDRCVRGKVEVPVDALWLAWKDWCQSDNRHPGTKAVFGRDLKAAVPSLKKRRPRSDDRDHVYEGIGLREDTLPNCRDHRDQRGDGEDAEGHSGHGGHSGHSNPEMYSQQGDRPAGPTVVTAPEVDDHARFDF